MQRGVSAIEECLLCVNSMQKGDFVLFEYGFGKTVGICIGCYGKSVEIEFFNEERQQIETCIRYGDCVIVTYGRSIVEDLLSI